MFYIDPVYFWLVVMILFIIFELLTMGLTTIWFAMGSLAALAVAAVGGPIWLQILVCFAVSLLALFCFRNVSKEYFNRNRIKTNADSLIGKKGIVTEDISNIHAAGQVTVAGQEWTARALNDEEVYEKGSMVVIRDIKGVKLIVEKE